MEELLTAAYEAMNNALRQVVTEAENNLQVYERSFRLIETTLREIQALTIAIPLSETQAQISFYKDFKPRFLSEYIFFQELLKFEKQMPVADVSRKQLYISAALSDCEHFFDSNKFLYNYYRTKSTDYDTSFFLSDSPPVFIDEIPAQDELLGTVNSYQYAKVQAIERLSAHLNTLKIALDKGLDLPLSQVPVDAPDLSWTDQKVGLIEFAYLIFCQHAINHGKAELKDIIRLFEIMFHVDLSNYRQVFNQNIRIRKKNRTAYIDDAKVNFIKYMDDLDIRPTF